MNITHPHPRRLRLPVLFFLALFLLLAAGLTAQEINEPSQREFNVDSSIRNGEPANGGQAVEGAVKIGVLNNFPPFAFMYRSELVGFTVDYIDLLAEKTGLEFQLVIGTWAEIYEKFRQGEVSMITALSFTEERTEFTRYTDPYYLLPTVVYTRENAFTYRGVESLRGKTVGLEEDVYYIEYLRQYPDIRIREIEDTRELMRSLSFGEMDAVITNINIGNFMIKHYMLDNLRLAGRIDISGIEDEDLRLGVRRERAELHALIQEGMNRISAAEYKRLQDTWAGFAPEGIRETLSPAEQELAERYRKEYGGIRLAVCHQWYPVNFIEEDGSHGGIIADIFDRITAERELEFVTRSYKDLNGSLKALRDGKVDIISGIVPNEELREDVSFTNPYLHLPLVAVTRDQEFFIGGLDSLRGKRIGCTERGDLQTELSERYPKLEFHTTDTVREGLERVRREEDYAFVGSIPSVAYAIKHYNFYNIKVAGTLEETLPVTAAVRKDSSRLRSMLEKSLNAVPKEERERIVDRWLAASLEERFDYTILWKLGLPILVLIIIVLIWTRKVQSYNKRITEVNRLLEDKNRELERLSTINQLTGLFNRNKIDEELAKEYERFLRYDRPFSLILGDIDGFKEVNDTYGHQSGDKVLQEIGRLFRERVRTADVPGRWGGEEFLIICPETEEAGALRLAEAMRRDIAAYHFSVDSGITISFGLAQIAPGEDVEALLRRVDERMYIAKQRGKNRVVDGETADQGEG